MHNRAVMGCRPSLSRNGRELAGPGRGAAVQRPPRVWRAFASAGAEAAAADAPDALTAAGDGSGGGGGRQQQPAAPWEAPPLSDAVLARNAALQVGRAAACSAVPHGPAWRPSQFKHHPASQSFELCPHAPPSPQ